ncbi:MAG: hybrid sensor histidine kinase/response regulator [Roseiflexaceae bacterium]
MDFSSYYSQFRDETIENLRSLTAGLIALTGGEIDPAERKAQIDAIFRAVHTIKGSSRLLGLEAIGRIAHVSENILGAVRAGSRTIDQALADDLLHAGDAIQELVNAVVDGTQANVDVDRVVARLEGVPAEPAAEPRATPVPPAAQPEPAPAAPAAPAVAAPPAPPAPQPVAMAPPALVDPLGEAAAVRKRNSGRQTIRVRVDRLDRLLNLAGELAVSHQMQADHGRALDDLRTLVVQQQRSLLALDDVLRKMRFTPAQRELLDRQINTALNVGDEAGRLIRAQSERFGQHLGQMDQLVDDLEQEVMAARLLPVSTLYANLPRAVRDLANAAGREIALVLEGETTELDRKMIEALGDPIIHMLRNAVDHGIEPPEEREQVGKPRQGTVRISAQALGGSVNLIVSDDGRGIDPQRIRQSAVRKGLIAPETAAQLTDQEALDLIFVPGFSTAPMITDISGRGVGMDVVRTNIAELGGQVLVESLVGQGTTLTMVLPLTLVTSRVLLVESSGQVFALPASGCRGTLWVYLEEARTIEGRAMISHEGRLTPLIRLSDLLGLPAANDLAGRNRIPTVLIGTAQRPIALLVDRLLDEREVVVKPLGPLMERLRQYAGATQMGDGRLVLMLSPTALTQMARGLALTLPSARRDARPRQSRLLVADDSFTTRELIRSILQSAGYDVITAVDGLDALDKLRDDTYDLVVSDVEMPRVDGFQLTARIRQELGRSNLPVVIITSLASEEHRRLGLEAGAQAYIVKSQFNQGNLLETVRQLLGS